jgi:branched-chain amino acid transport system ATP-binding protein
MSRPKLIMFDEPSLGLAPIVVSEMFEIIRKIRREQGIPVVLVEQNAYKALQISDRSYILENGKVVLTSASAELIQNPEVKKAYLGG